MVGRRNEMPSMLYSVKDAAITDFVYKYHILAGDFLRESEFNMRTLIDGGKSYFTAIMGDLHTYLDHTHYAYETVGDLHNMILTTEYKEARAFLFRVNEMKDGLAYGDILFTNLDFLRKDIDSHTITPKGISFVDQNGAEKSVDFKQWAEMDLWEKDSLKYWKYNFSAEDLADTQHRYTSNFEKWISLSDNITADYLLERLNNEYMCEAEHPQQNMYRIPLETAKQMLLYNDAPVYRLLPGEPEQLQPLTAIKTGLWYSFYRAFAIKREHFAGLNKMCQREINRFTGKISERRTPQKASPIQGR